MERQPLTIGFARRGYSRSGGAEAYLKRLVQGVMESGCGAHLFADHSWPGDAWPFDAITRLRARNARAFADELEIARRGVGCDVLLSLERVWRCDVYRAGDGVHAAWLERRPNRVGAFKNLVRGFNRKHRTALALEQSLFAEAGAGRVIANSHMVKTEIIEFYGYDAAKIDVIYNGVPASEFAAAHEKRSEQRAALGLTPSEIAVLFVGSGWERKGLRVAVDAVNETGARLFVAGRGPAGRYRSERVTYLGEVDDTTALYSAADIFLLPTTYDPFSNACLEALAAGLPVITTSANGFAEIIENQVHGSIIEEPDDIGAIAHALRFWADPKHREEARQKNIRRAAEFDMSVNVQRTLDVLFQVADKAESTSGKIRKT